MSRMDGAWERRCRPLLGTFVEVAVPPSHGGAIEAAFAAMARVHAAMSFHDERSDLARLRNAPVGAAVRVDEGTISVMRIAIDLHRRTGGLFDVCVARHLVMDGLLPRSGPLEPRDATGTTGDIVILDDRHVVCTRPMLIDLGGIAKGFAVDQAVEALAGAGVPNAIVNAGGDLRVLGDEPVTVHIRSALGLIAALALAAGAVATSGSNSDRSVHRGRSGVPLHFLSPVTVAAPTCIIADAMTKVAIADLSLARRLLADAGGCIVNVDAKAVA